MGAPGPSGHEQDREGDERERDAEDWPGVALVFVHGRCFRVRDDMESIARQAACDVADAPNGKCGIFLAARSPARA